MRYASVPTTFVVTVAAFGIAACGTSQAEVRTAESSGYQVGFAVVYNETLTAVRKLYPHLIEDARAGVIKTAWHPVHVSQTADIDPQATQTGAMGPVGGTVQGRAVQAQAYQQQYFVRFQVHVVGGRPWRVHVEGQAALWRSGEIPTPLHGADVPQWLRGRIEALEVAIYHRLQKYAVVVQYHQKPVKAAPPPPDQHLFGKVPPAAAQVIARVDQAAATSNVQALRALMADQFTYSVGQDPSADTAIAVWQADPTTLVTMKKTLEAGCAADPKKPEVVVCPASSLQDPAFAGYRAGFQQVGGGWKMVYFVSGS